MICWACPVWVCSTSATNSTPARLPNTASTASSGGLKAVAAGYVVLERASLGVGQQPGKLVAHGVHCGLAGERVYNIVCSASPGTAPSAILSRVQTFMLMTIPMISRISSREKCSASASCRAPKSSATVASATRVIASV